MRAFNSSFFQIWGWVWDFFFSYSRQNSLGDKLIWTVACCFLMGSWSSINFEDVSASIFSYLTESPLKIWKMAFISFEKLFSFTSYSNFRVSFFPCQSLQYHMIIKVHDVIMWPRNLTTRSIDAYYIRKLFIEKLCKKIIPKSSTRPLFELDN